MLMLTWMHIPYWYRFTHLCNTLKRLSPASKLCKLSCLEWSGNVMFQAFFHFVSFAIWLVQVGSSKKRAKNLSFKWASKFWCGKKLGRKILVPKRSFITEGFELNFFYKILLLWRKKKSFREGNIIVNFQVKKREREREREGGGKNRRNGNKWARCQDENCFNNFGSIFQPTGRHCFAKKKMNKEKKSIELSLVSAENRQQKRNKKYEKEEERVKGSKKNKRKKANKTNTDIQFQTKIKYNKFFFYQPLMKVWNNPSHDFLKQERVRTSFLTRVSFVLQFYIYFVLKCGGHGQSDFGASCP